MDYRIAIFQFLGGLGIFLFSIKYMGDGLQMSAGDKLRHILDKYTTNPFLGVLTGVLVTMLIQSSSATTVITIGLVGAGLLNLRQSIGIVMGANIGTTMTSFIIGFDLSAYALPIIFLGSFLLFFTNKEKYTNLGRILYGFGGIFFALTLMSNAMKPLKDFSWFSELMLTLADNSILGVLAGTFLTVLIQSSSATIGILQSLYSDGLITLDAGLPVLFGDNIGTTITAILACLGASAVAKRVALSHVLFNVVGTVIFIILLAPFKYFIIMAQSYLGLTPKLTIAFAHGSFNLINTIIQFPFIWLIAKTVETIIPLSKEEKVYQTEYLDEMLIHSAPSIAIGNARKEIVKLYDKAVKNFAVFEEYFKTKDSEKYKIMMTNEEEIDKRDNEITKYITDIISGTLTVKDSEQASILLDITRDIERTADHNYSIAFDYNRLLKKKVSFSDNAKNDIIILINYTSNMLNLSYEAFVEENKYKAREVIEKYSELAAIEKKIRKRHLKRLEHSKCESKAAMYFVDNVTEYVRMCELSKNICLKIVNE